MLEKQTNHAYLPFNIFLTFLQILILVKNQTESVAHAN
jgi:hypothetical protein